MNPYGDSPRHSEDFPPRQPTRRITPLCRCGHSGRLMEDDNGYTVECTNRFCTEPLVADNEACHTKAGAWQQWWWKQTGAIR